MAAGDDGSFDSLLECVICTDILEDPRVLPCGHSYCGPPRSCLQALKQGPAGFKCAICGCFFNQKIESLKPLYGLRDFIKQQASKITPEKVKPNVLKVDCNCRKVKKSPASFWCHSCLTAICNECLVSKHKDHEFAIFDARSQSIMRSQIWFLEKQRENLRNALTDNFDKVQGRFEKAESEFRKMLELEKEVDSIEQKFNELETSFVDGKSTANNETVNWLYSFEVPKFVFSTGSKDTGSQTDASTVQSSRPETSPSLNPFNPLNLLYQSTSQIPNLSSLLSHDAENSDSPKSMTIFLPFRYQGNSNIQWSNYVSIDETVLKIGIERDLNMLKMHMDVVQIESPVKVSVFVKKQKGRDFWVWKLFKIGVAMYHRTTKLPWGHLKRSFGQLNEVVQIKVDIVPAVRPRRVSIDSDGGVSDFNSYVYGVCETDSD